ncbi:MAG: hypothetical protein DWH96_03675, partial [Planctomycetota bacterium]
QHRKPRKMIREVLLRGSHIFDSNSRVFVKRKKAINKDEFHARRMLTQPQTIAHKRLQTPMFLDYG